MRYLFLFIVSLISLITTLLASAYGDEACSQTSEHSSIEEQLEINTDVPKNLKGAYIAVLSPDGKRILGLMRANEFKVVPRKQQFIVTKIKSTETLSCRSEEQKNRVFLLGGAGPKGNLTISSDGSKVTVSTETGAIGGLGYQRKISTDVSIGAQVQTNESALISIGLDF